MNFVELSKKLQTISAINLTPFHKETKKIDWQGLEDNINFLLDNGTQVIVPCGNTGEFYALTLEEAKNVTKKVVELVNGRAIVMAGIGYSVDIAVDLGKYAQDAGADCVMIHQPIHPYVTNQGAASYFKEIINALDIPSVLYFKDPNLSDDIVKELAELEKLIGVKYAINDLPRFRKLSREIPPEHNVTLICGTAEKWAPFFFNAGATGFTSGLINLYPELSFSLLEALRNEEKETVWKRWEESLAFEDLRAKYNNGNNVIVIKEAFEQLGLRAGVTREPVGSLAEDEKKEVTKILQRWGLLQTERVTSKS